MSLAGCFPNHLVHVMFSHDLAIYPPTLSKRNAYQKLYTMNLRCLKTTTDKSEYSSSDERLAKYSTYNRQDQKTR